MIFLHTQIFLPQKPRPEEVFSFFYTFWKLIKLDITYRGTLLSVSVCQGQYLSPPPPRGAPLFPMAKIFPYQHPSFSSILFSVGFQSSFFILFLSVGTPKYYMGNLPTLQVKICLYRSSLHFASPRQ